MSEERRSHERKTLDREANEIPGHFYMIIDEQRIEFSRVQDVSVSGMGVILSQRIAVGTDIELVFDSADFLVKLHAMVAWEESCKDGWRLGIQFDTRNMNDNVMFFMTLREYLDQFDQNLHFG